MTVPILNYLAVPLFASRAEVRCPRTRAAARAAAQATARATQASSADASSLSVQPFPWLPSEVPVSVALLLASLSSVAGRGLVAPQAGDGAKKKKFPPTRELWLGRGLVAPQAGDGAKKKKFPPTRELSSQGGDEVAGVPARGLSGERSGMGALRGAWRWKVTPARGCAC